MAADLLPWKPLTLALVCATSCAFDVEVPLQARISCADDGECPPDFVCPLTEPTQARVCVSTTAPACGNGRLDPGEECDDGALLSGDGCSARCATEGCGNGVLDPEEVCDDGNLESGDGCRSDCGKIERCGDGVIDTGEACDDGNDDDNDRCSAGCVLNVCGDGVVFLGRELCDDGNVLDGDGCRSDCGKVELCGDGVLDSGEACDDGNNNPNDGCDLCALTRWLAEVVTGLGPGAGVPVETPLSQPIALALDLGGNLYISGDCEVWRLSAEGVLTVVVGDGVCAYAGDGGPAALARVSFPGGLDTDASGALYIADGDSARIRRVNAEGIIETVVGSGAFESSGDGGAATAAGIGFPVDVKLGPDGSMYIGDLIGGNIRRVRPDGIIENFAGNGSSQETGDGGAAVDAGLREVEGFALGPDGALYIPGRNTIRRVGADGVIELFAGDGTNVFSGDDGPALNAGLSARSIAFRGTGELLFSDSVESGVRFREIDAAGIIRTVAGGAERDFTGDGGDALAARFATASGIAARGAELWIADFSNNRVRLVDAAGIVTTAAGNGEDRAFISGTRPTSNRASAASIAFDATGRLNFASAGRVRFIDDKGLVQSFAVTGGAAEIARAVDGALLATSGDQILRLSEGAEPVVIAGTGTAGYAGDGGPAVEAELRSLSALAIADNGDIFVAQRSDHVIRRVRATDGIIETYAGTGVAGFAGDGFDRLTAQFNDPIALAFAPDGALLISDIVNRRLRRIAPDGTVSTLAGTGVAGTSGNGGPAVDAQMFTMFGLGTTPSGEILIGDSTLLRRIRVDGVIEIVAGGGLPAGALGDGGPALSAELGFVRDVEVNAAGDIFIADPDSGRIRRIDANGIIHSIAGALHPPAGPLERSRLPGGAALVSLSASRLLATTFLAGRVATLDLGERTLDFVVGQSGGYELGDDPLLGSENQASVMRLLRDATGLAFDGDDTVYVAERGAGVILQLRVPDVDDPRGWTVRPFAGAEDEAVHRDGTLADARFAGPAGLALDPASGQLYVADELSHTVRQIDLALGLVSTLHGEPGLGGSFDGLLFSPAAVAIDDVGAVFVSDTENHRVLRVDGAGGATVIIGTGEAGSAGDGAPANAFPVRSPAGLAFDEIGNLLVTSTHTLRLVSADEQGLVDGTGSVTTLYGRFPRTTFPEVATNCLQAVLPRAPGVVTVTDSCQGYVIELTRERLP